MHPDEPEAQARGPLWHTEAVRQTSIESATAFADRIGARCPRCEYILRGLAEPVCPECGRPFSLDELVKSRYAPRLHVVIGFGFLASSMILGATIILAPLAFVYFASAIWWAAAQHRVAEMSLGLRRLLVVIAWLPLVGILGFIAVSIFGLLLF